MKSYSDNKEWLGAVLSMLSAHFGKDVEFVIHDLSLDYEHTIVDIRNGQITGRKIGDTGDILGLEVIRGTADGKKSYFNYINYTKDGKTLRSSTLFLADESGKPSVCIGINEDITQSVELENYLREKNGVSTPNEDDKSQGRGNVNEILDYLLKAAQLRIGKNTALMTKEDKMDYIRYLDHRGTFLITKSGPRVCEALGISKFTLYRYLDIIRKEDEVNGR